MNTRMRLGGMLVLLYALGIVILLFAGYTGSDENEMLLFVCNALFTGLIPLMVAAFAGYAYIQNNGVNALFMSCGMLALGMGSAIAGIHRFRPDSANISVTVYNTCLFLCAVCQLAASQKVFLLKTGTSRNREWKLALAFSMTCFGVIGLLAAALSGMTPYFMDHNGSTRLRDAVLLLSAAFYFFAFLQMYKQYKNYSAGYLYWYSLYLAMMAQGALAVFITGGLGTIMNWAGRAAQYIGTLFALFSILQAVQAAKRHGSSLTAIMAEFFSGDKDNYISLAEHAAQAVITADGKGRIFFANTAAAQMLHYDKRELMLASFFDLFQEPDRSFIRRDFEMYALHKTSRLAMPMEMQVSGRGCRLVPVEIAAIYRTLPAGYACTYVLYDISERKQAAQALQRKEALLQDIIDGTEDPVFIKDCNSVILMGNRALSQAMGLPLDQIIGSTDAQVYTDPQIAKTIMDNDRQVLLLRSAMSFEETVPTPDGPRTYLSNKTPWMDEKGGLLGIIGIAHDITSRKDMETELRRKTVELEEKNRLITDFFINISHEFKTPLSIILLLTDMMEEETGRMGMQNADDGRFLKMMRVNAYRLRRLVANLLDITKLDAGFMEPQWDYMDVAALLKSVVASADFYAAKKGIAMSFSACPDKLYMSTDSLMLERILMNLLSNAMKHTPPGGAIRVAFSEHDGTAVITVADNGEGIPEEKRDVIFDRFRQVNTSLARTSEGCGIGLSITKALTELLGGNISFQSELKVGSVFSVELPVKHYQVDGHNADFSGMGLHSRVQMELSDIDFG